MNRRTLLIGGGAALGLMVGWTFWPRDPIVKLPTNAGETALGGWIKITRAGQVIVAVPQAELGQGSYSVIAQIIADELGADWKRIGVEPAPISALYANTAFIADNRAAATPRPGVPDMVPDAIHWLRDHSIAEPIALFTGAGTTVRSFEVPCREAAAMARTLLQRAAARQWGIDWTQCTAINNRIVAGKRSIDFGAIAAAAAKESPDDEIQLRASDDASLIGQELPRLDLPSKIDGSAPFAGDIRLSGMVYASIRQGPYGTTRVADVHVAAARAIPGFRQAIIEPNWVAAVATNSWAAMRALDALAPTFSSNSASINSTAINRLLDQQVRDAGVRVAATGDIDAALDGRGVHRVTYTADPALHAQLETRTAVAAPDGTHMRVWVGTQAPAVTRRAISSALGIDEQQVVLFPTIVGGSTGMAMDYDVAVKAALIARTINAPVQLCLSRGEDMRRDMPRAPARARMAATLRDGRIDGWLAHIATPPARHEFWARMGGATAEQAMHDTSDNSDAAAVAGAMPPYAIAHVGVDHVSAQTGLPSGFYRGGAAGVMTFFTESFVDEMAALAGVDPFLFRMQMLGGHADLARCLQTMSVIGDWQGSTSTTAQGIACQSMHGSHIALLAEAGFNPGGGIKVNRLVAVVDCGRVINPSLVRQQIEGGLIAGIASCVGTSSDYAHGRPVIQHYGGMNLPRLDHMPEIVVELIDSNRDPGGVSDLALPVVAPAVANALFAATGNRLRHLPLVRSSTTAT